MPSLAYNTQVKEAGDDFTLTINAKHILSAEEDSGPPISAKGRPPEDIDIVLKADLVLSFAAAADGRPVSGSCLQASYCLQHVLSYLKTNQHQLGLSMVSDCYVTDDDRPKVTISSAGAYGLPGGLKHHGHPSLSLEVIDITFALKSVRKEIAENMFSETAYLPFTTALDRAMHRFVTVHLIKRYPLIFGGWRRKVDSELTYIPSVARSMLNIIERSTDAGIKERSEQLITVLGEGLSLAASRSRRKLIEHASLPGLAGVDADEEQTREDILTRSTARLLKVAVRPVWSKATAFLSAKALNRPQEELELGIHIDNNSPSGIPPLRSKLAAHELCWDDLPLLSLRQTPLCAHDDLESGALGTSTEEDDEDEYFDFGDIEDTDYDDAFLDDSQDPEDDVDMMLHSDDSDVSEGALLFYEENDVIAQDLPADDDLDWLPADMEDDPYNSISHFPSDDEFDLPSSQSQDDDLLTPQDSQDPLLEYTDDLDYPSPDMSFSVDDGTIPFQFPHLYRSNSPLPRSPVPCEPIHLDSDQEELHPIALYEVEDADGVSDDEDDLRLEDAFSDDHCVLDDF